MRTEDGYIINKCLNGDSSAFGLLVDKYKESIYAMAYSKLHNFHDAEDVTQEVFIKAYQRLRMLKRWESFLAWLYAITSNLCKNHIRAQSRRPDQRLLEDQESPAIDYHSLDSYGRNLTDEDTQETLKEAMDKLPETYQQVLSLYYLGGMSNREIARFLGANINAIEQRLSRARARLKEEVIVMMRDDFAERRLRAGFTLRIVELVKRMKIQPMPRMPWLPWGIPMATGIIITVVGIILHLFSFSPLSIGSELPGEGFLDYSSQISGSDNSFYVPSTQKDALMTYAEVPVELTSLAGNSIEQHSQDEGAKPADKDGSMAIAGNVPVRLQLKPLLGEEIIYKVGAEHETELPGFGIMKTSLEGEVARICMDVDNSGVMTLVTLIHFEQPDMVLADATPEAERKFEEYKTSGFFNQFLVTDTFGMQRLKPDGMILSDPLVVTNMQGMINLSDLQLAYFPDKAVNVSENWSAESSKYSLKSTLMGFEEIQGYKCAKIQSDVDSKDPDIALTGQTTEFLAVEEGFIVKSLNNSEYMMINGSKTNALISYELSSKRKIPQEDFVKMKQEVLELNDCLALLADSKVDEAKAAFQEFLNTYPDSYFTKGVEGSIAQIDVMKSALGAMKEQMKDE